MALQEALIVRSRVRSQLIKVMTHRIVASTLAALLTIATSLSLTAGEQAAAPRPTAPSLMRPDSAVKPADAEGFLRRWVVLEPIAAKGPLIESVVRATVTREPFLTQLAAVPAGGETVAVGGQTLAWHALDTKAYNVNLYHFAYALSKPTSNVLFWAVTVVDAPRAMTGVRLAIGSNAASIWWVNGEEVIGLYNDRQTVIDDGVSRRLTLKKGANVVRAAIVNGGGATDFCARFLDADDRPITTLRVNLGLR
jgi:hypothetical protein